MDDRQQIESILASSSNRAVLVENLVAYVARVRASAGKASPAEDVTLKEPDKGVDQDPIPPYRPRRGR